VPFDPVHAATVAAWVRTDEELLWLAPSTGGPLTAEKVAGWARPEGDAFLYVEQPEALPLAYGELNPMRRAPGHFWLGHVIVDPARRARRLGQAFVRALSHHAFRRLGANKLSLIVFPGNHAAVECYLRVGFRIVGEEFHRFGMRRNKHRFLRLEVVRTRVRRAP
jgi:RimJ/RimL family protein N-acetyltransferase